MASWVVSLAQVAGPRLTCPQDLGPGRDLVAGGQSVGVGGAQDPDLVGQQLLGQAQRPRGVPAPAGPGRDVAAGGQGVGVGGAQDPDPVGQQLLGQALPLLRPRAALPAS
jgi:hypothetical protein